MADPGSPATLSAPCARVSTAAVWATSRSFLLFRNAGPIVQAAAHELSPLSPPSRWSAAYSLRPVPTGVRRANNPLFLFPRRFERSRVMSFSLFSSSLSTRRIACSFSTCLLCVLSMLTLLSWFLCPRPSTLSRPTRLSIKENPFILLFCPYSAPCQVPPAATT